jgi:hypothetical protein
MARLVPRVHGNATMKGMKTDDLLCSSNARAQKSGRRPARLSFLLAERAR